MTNTADHYDIIIVGSGIAGLSLAYFATVKGYKTCLIEKDKFPDGASIRNFGFIWPIGQTSIMDRELALRSREIWNELSGKAGFWINNTGSVFPLTTTEGMDLADEFIKSDNHKLFGCSLLVKDEAASSLSLFNEEIIKGYLLSATESRINPPEAIAKIIDYLEYDNGVAFHFNEKVITVENGEVRTSTGKYFADHIFLCTGKHTDILPNSDSGKVVMKPCKLHMIKYGLKGINWNFPYCIGTEYSLLHYPVFRNFISYDSLYKRMINDIPEIETYGLNIMAGFNDRMELTIGDSHEYKFLKENEINDEIIRLINKGIFTLFHFKDNIISHLKTWTGIYMDGSPESYIINHYKQGITLFNGLGGRGMTISFALAEKMINEL